MQALQIVKAFNAFTEFTDARRETQHIQLEEANAEMLYAQRNCLRPLVSAVRSDSKKWWISRSYSLLIDVVSESALMIVVKILKTERQCIYIRRSHIFNNTYEYEIFRHIAKYMDLLCENFAMWRN